jgi:hypothetical protein
MGLNFTQCNAQWSYSGFMDFRIKLAKEIGINLREMEFFKKEQTGMSWKNVKDNIKPLLIHSDCDGIMLPKTCAKVAPRLRQLVSEWEDSHDKRQAIELAKGMDECVKKRISLRFV